MESASPESGGFPLSAGARPADPQATSVMEEFATAAAGRSALPEPQRTEARLELLSHLYDAALAKARLDGSERVTIVHARMATSGLGDTAAVDQAFFARHRASVKPAGFLVRGVAFLLEWGLLVGFIFMFEGIGSGFLPFAFWFTPVQEFALATIVLMLFESVNGQTPGKMLFGLRVVRKDGSPIDMEKAVLRNLTKVFPAIILLDAVLGWLAFRDENTRLSDRYVGTIVVKEVR